MADPFHTKIGQALADPALQSALDANAERRRSARQQSYASLPEDLASMRQRAKAARQRTIDNLDSLLGQFVHRAEANGLIVHQAADAQQAIAIVLDIAQRHQARLITKSKSMVSEEIHLNPALEAAGLQVIESDLGEYIVQLRQEPPAHIITPAVHLSRAQVGELFAEKFGVPYTEDIPTLTAIARQKLRQAFLETDIGISGVNFGVAENGLLCLLTNEGNGRMVTTLPRVHIALMGIERLAATMVDLDLYLHLLPRAATGQKLTVYANLVRAPSQEGEMDGPQERHLILLDNGRRAIRTGRLAEILNCIRCGACLNACPVFREIGGHAYLSASGRHTPYPGPVGSVVSPALFGQAEFGNLAHASSLCGACQEACPVDIDLPGLLLRVRAGAANDQDAPHVATGLRWGLQLFAWAAASPRLFGMAQRMLGLFSTLASPRQAWLRLPAISGWGVGRDFPRPAQRPFRSRFQAARSNTSSDEGQRQRAHTITISSDTSLKSSRQASDLSNLVEQFAAELSALGAQFVRCSAEQVSKHVMRVLQARQIEAIQSWGEEFLPAGVIETLRSQGIRVENQPDPMLRAGLTGVLAGIAETGSLVLTGGPGRPLSASLLPETHIAIVKADQIKARLLEGLQLDELNHATACVLISGPSRTADIEMTLTIGVHGPGELVVVCIE